jgi:cytochrome c oxidase subunit III
MEMLWFNTGLLFASSLAFHHAWTCARRGEAGRVRMALLAGGLLGFGFLVGQVLLWRHYEASGYVMAARFAVCASGVDPLSITIPETRSGNPAIAFFYLICGLHGIHILGGLAAWAVAVRRVIKGEALDAVARSIQLCARYWHFMLLVWLAMAALFVAT